MTTIAQDVSFCIGNNHAFHWRDVTGSNSFASWILVTAQNMQETCADGLSQKVVYIPGWWAAGSQALSNRACTLATTLPKRQHHIASMSAQIRQHKAMGLVGCQGTVMVNWAVCVCVCVWLGYIPCAVCDGVVDCGASRLSRYSDGKLGRVCVRVCVCVAGLHTLRCLWWCSGLWS